MKAVIILLMLIMPAAAMNYTVCNSSGCCWQVHPGELIWDGNTSVEFPANTAFSLEELRELHGYDRLELRGPTQAEMEAMWKNNPPALYIAPLGLKIPLAPWMVEPLNYILSYF